MPYKAWSPPRRAGCSPSVSDPRLHVVDGVPAYVSPGNNPTCMMAPPSELNGEPAGDLYGFPILPEAHELNPPGDWPSSARDVIPNNTTYSFMPGTHAAASSSRPKRQVNHPGQNRDWYPSSGTMNMRGYPQYLALVHVAAALFLNIITYVSPLVLPVTLKAVIAVWTHQPLIAYTQIRSP